jgi:hypothetical protein
MRAKVVSKDVSAREMVLKHKLPESIPYTPKG